LRYVGSAYLVWLGLSMIRDARTNAQAKVHLGQVGHKPLGTIVWQGILVELLNPKTVLFFALFLPPFISVGSGAADQSSVSMQLLVLGALVPLTAIPSDLAVAYMGGSMTKMINRQKAMREALAWIGGVILMGIALNLHLGFL